MCLRTDVLTLCAVCRGDPGVPTEQGARGKVESTSTPLGNPARSRVREVPDLPPPKLHKPCAQRSGSCEPGKHHSLLPRKQHQFSHSAAPLRLLASVSESGPLLFIASGSKDNKRITKKLCFSFIK